MTCRGCDAEQQERAPLALQEVLAAHEASEDRILTTHVGRLVRPQELLKLSAEVRPGGDLQLYEDHLKKSVAEVVQAQAKAGIDVVNDGELGKSGWANYALGRVSGFEERPNQMYPALWLGRDRVRFAEFMAKEFPRGVTGTPGHACVRPIAYRDRKSVARDVANLKSAVEAASVEEAFFSALAPASVGYDAANEYYPNEPTTCSRSRIGARLVSKELWRR